MRTSLWDFMGEVAEIPSINTQHPENLQIPSSKSGFKQLKTHCWSLGIWNSSGCWVLMLGISGLPVHKFQFLLQNQVDSKGKILL
jgi:hypothetical protein